MLYWGNSKGAGVMGQRYATLVQRLGDGAVFYPSVDMNVSNFQVYDDLSIPRPAWYFVRLKLVRNGIFSLFRWSWQETGEIWETDSPMGWYIVPDSSALRNSFIKLAKVYGVKEIRGTTWPV